METVRTCEIPMMSGEPIGLEMEPPEDVSEGPGNTNHSPGASVPMFELTTLPPGPEFDQKADFARGEIVPYSVTLKFAAVASGTQRKSHFVKLAASTPQIH